MWAAGIAPPPSIEQQMVVHALLRWNPAAARSPEKVVLAETMVAAVGVVVDAQVAGRRRIDELISSLAHG
ncbi:hypothetical protein BHE74_00029966 [Ensete ventricosum]|nr:hypothetical protein BHE74_00029966 [Ensete ventricosum]